MYSAKSNIFVNYFAKIFHTDDPNKDVNEEGTLRRFTETLAEDWDDTVVAPIQNLIDDTLVPITVKDKFIPFLEKQVGLSPIHSDIAIRRRVLSRISEIYKRKGTLDSYRLIFNALGFDDVEITAAGVDYGFDSSVTFENEVRTFDLGRCHKCKYYEINLIGTVAINDAMFLAINKAIKLVEPIYARHYNLSYNGTDINSLNIFVDDNGDLIYNTADDSQVGFSLSPNGDLSVFGTDSANYTLDSNGNLIYNN